MFGELGGYLTSFGWLGKQKKRIDAPQPANYKIAMEMPWLNELIRTGAGASQTIWSVFSRNPTGETMKIRQYYKEAWKEPAVKTSLMHKVYSVCQLSLDFSPEDKYDPRQKEVAEALRLSIVNSTGGFFRFAWNVLVHAMQEGWSVCEPVWTIGQNGKLKGLTTLAKLKAKDTDYLWPIVDNWRNVIGIKATSFNAAVVYPPEAFVIFSYCPLFENPTGLSDLRAAVRSFQMKDAALRLRMIFLENYVGPFLKGKYSAESVKGKLVAALKNAKAGGYLIYPEGTEVEISDMAMSGTTDFQNAIDYFDKDIIVSIKGSHLTTLEGTTKNGAGDSSVQKDTEELFVWALAEELQTAIEQYANLFVYRNYGMGVPCPQAKLSAINPAAIVADLQIDKILQEMGMDLSKEGLLERAGRTAPKDPEDVLKPPSLANGFGGGLGLGGIPGINPQAQNPPPPISQIPDSKPVDLNNPPQAQKPPTAPPQNEPPLPLFEDVFTDKNGHTWYEFRDYAEHFAEEDWTHTQGKRGGSIWVNVNTGETQYGAQNPDLGIHRKDGSAETEKTRKGIRGLISRTIEKAKPYIMKLAQVAGDYAPDILDTPDDYAKITYHKAGDMLMQQTGIPSGVAVTIVTQVMSRLLVSARNKFRKQQTFQAVDITPDTIAITRELIELMNSIFGVQVLPVPDDSQIEKILQARNNKPAQQPNQPQAQGGNTQQGGPQVKADDAPLNSQNVIVHDTIKPANGKPSIAVHNAHQIEKLLAESQKAGAQVIYDLSKTALERIVKTGSLSMGGFFTPEERETLTKTIQDVGVSANLLGRTRLREQFADSTAPAFRTFADESATTPSGVPKLVSEKAVEFFKNLMPDLSIDPAQYLAEQKARAFTMAATTERTILEKVWGSILKRMQTGEDLSNAASEIESILDSAGLTPANPQYSDMVWRTNVNGFFNEGYQAEMKAPGLAEEFPVWEYLGIPDGREGDDHKPKFGRFYPASITFAEVRGSRPYNCRCGMRAVHKTEWAERQRGGAKIGGPIGDF